MQFNCGGPTGTGAFYAVGAAFFLKDTIKDIVDC